MAKKKEYPMQIDDLGLTEKELRFLMEYVTNGFNATAAYKHAKMQKPGQTDVEMRIAALALTNKSAIKRGVTRYTSAVVGPYKDRLEMQLLEVDRARAFYDPLDFFDSNGRVKPLDEIPSELRYAIDGVTEDFKGRDGNVRVVSYKIADRNTAMKNLRTMLGKVEDGDTNPVKVSADQRARTRAIIDAGVKGIAAGIREGRKQRDAEIKTANAESISTEYEIDIPVDDLPPEYNEAVQDIIEAEDAYDADVAMVDDAPIVRKALSAPIPGMGVDSPILQKARELAMQRINKKHGKE